MILILKLPGLITLSIWHFLIWWYKDVPLFFLYFLKNTLLAFSNLLAIRVMLRSLFIPLFHDYTILGRILSFFFRLIRIIVGFSASVILTIIFICLFLIWMVLPVFIVLEFISSLLGRL